MAAPEEDEIEALVECYLPYYYDWEDEESISEIFTHFEDAGIYWEPEGIVTTLDASYFPSKTPEITVEILKHVKDIRVLKAMILSSRYFYELGQKNVSIWRSHLERATGLNFPVEKLENPQLAYWAIMRLPVSSRRLLAEIFLGRLKRYSVTHELVLEWIVRYAPAEIIKASLPKVKSIDPESLSHCYLYVCGRSSVILTAVLNVIKRRKHIPGVEGLIEGAIDLGDMKMVNRITNTFPKYSEFLSGRLFKIYGYKWNQHKDSKERQTLLKELLRLLKALPPFSDPIEVYEYELTNFVGFLQEFDDEKLYHDYWEYFFKECDIETFPSHVLDKVDYSLLEALLGRKGDLETTIARYLYLFARRENLELYDQILALLTKSQSFYANTKLLQVLASKQRIEERHRVIDLVASRKVPALPFFNGILKTLLEIEDYDSLLELKERFPNNFVITKAPSPDRTHWEGLFRQWGSHWDRAKFNKIFPGI